MQWDGFSQKKTTFVKIIKGTLLLRNRGPKGETLAISGASIFGVGLCCDFKEEGPGAEAYFSFDSLGNEGQKFGERGPGHRKEKIRTAGKKEGGVLAWEGTVRVPYLKTPTG